ncbi:NHLP bacteriocin export ABC transporter permease/ATPase subunit [Stenomitos frigidus]|uniref:NHLP bacteriocin export ABC transporter permease/ATPase subunit n=1 Tax=Stenomitos frigidus ULC18 TaxID=2107698 RepID=A0A2T1ECQ7_9CYAN|nr:NHLP bacteriocin export ABC transporter permease/ATPase subunit [Stenomitos frigidus]PSB30537.1 NHLP bacteriocin export ABC transporter permease/ATPase subunit [Stenomitos frigidus ULC18]
MLKQLDDTELQPQLRTIQGNQAVLLDDPESFWIIKAGSMSVFTVALADGMPSGARHHLFNASAGEALFSTADDRGMESGRGLLAVAIEETELLQCSIWQLGNPATTTDLDAISLLETWINHVSAALKLMATDAVSVPAIGRKFLSLTPGQTFEPFKGTVAWVQVQQGTARWMGLATAPLTSASAMMPFSQGLWLQAETTIEIALLETNELEDLETLLAGLTQLHGQFLHCLDIIEQQTTAEAFRRFQEREVLNRQVTESTLDALASVLQPQSLPALPTDGTPLLVAAGAVGRAMAVTIQPPARSEALNRVKDPLEAIARASRLRMRRVLLTHRWWQRDNGPLLAYTDPDRDPVALLPAAAGRYELFDPVSRQRVLVDEQVAATLAPEAFMFYRPLGDSVKRPLDLLFFSLKGHQLDLILLVVTGLAATLLGMLIPQATAILIDSAIPDGDRGLLLQLGLALFAVAIGQTAFEMARGVVSLRVETAADAVLQPAVWDNLLSLKPSFFRQYSSGDIQSRVLSVGKIRRQVSGATLRTVFSSVFALLNLGLMFVYSWQLALIACVLAFITVFVTIASSMLNLRQVRPLQQLDGLLLGLTVQLINGVAKLRVAAAEERAFAYWGKKYSHQKKLMAKSQRIDDSVAVFNEVLPTVSAVLLFWFAILFIQQSRGDATTGLSAGVFLAFNAAFGIFIQGARDLSNTLINTLNIIPLWERAQSIVKAEPEVDASKTDPGRLTGRLALEHVTFRYREDGPLILDDVTIRAEPGEFVAVVGPSGSGKSTVFRLLLGFETPASGTVYYDGQDLSGLDVNAVRRQLGVVLQNGRISTGSLFEIITGGALVTMDEAWEAANNAGFADDIKQMPMGMHTVISEGATNLSGGQRQRLLIARALVLKPKIILMDEATSALDNNTQAVITESLYRMNATRVVIAHRLSTIRDADRIYVVEAGRVVQMGHFDELVQQEGGLFARLAARQLE